MQIRGLLIAVGVLALLSGALWWTNKNPQDASKKPNEKLENLTTLMQADLVEVSVTRKGEAPLVLRKPAGGGNWEMVLTPALPTSVTDALDVVSNASTVTGDSVVDENATDLVQYGLEPAQITVSLKDKSGKTQQVLIGDQAPVGMKYYARRPNEKKVFTVPLATYTGINRTVNDLRDKRLLVIDESKLAKVEVVRKSETLEFTKGRQSLWQMVKPQPFRTDATVVDEILNKLREAKFDPKLAEDTVKKNAAGFAAGAVLGSLRLTAGAVAQLEIRKSKDNEYLGKSSTTDGIHKLSDELGKSVEKTLDDFRSKKLTDFGFEDPARIELDFGGKKSTLEHKGADWIWNGKKADAESVNGLLDALRGFGALSFVDKKFTAPVSTLTITHRDGKTIEKVLIAKVGNFVYAMRQGEIGEYEIDPKTLSDLEATAGKIKEAGAAKK